jgi:hypothetical protein
MSFNFKNFRLTRICLLATVLIAASLQVQAQNLPSGEYLSEGGGGALVITSNRNFTIGVVGGNAHTCDLSGVIAAGKAKMEDSNCVVSFKLVGPNIQVDTNESPDCTSYCGARASFTDLYLKPSAECTRLAVQTRRKTFKTRYDQKNYAEARSTLEPLLTQCQKTLDWIDTGWIRNDLALTQHKLGDKAACRQTLQPLAKDAAKSERQIREENAPTDADNYMPILKATRTNLKLCKAA